MTRILLRDLTPGTNYKVQFRAVDGDSVSEWSRLFDLPTETDNVAPDVPAWAAVDPWVTNGDTFVATWEPLDSNLDQNKDFSHYEIQFTDGSTQTVFRTTNTSYTLTFEQNRIQFGTAQASLFAKVRAVDAVGNASAWTVELQATNPAPAAVNSITVVSMYDAVDVSYDATLPEDFSHFTVQVSTTSASLGFNTVYEGPNTSFTHPTTSFLVDHWYRVFVVDKFGSLSPSVTSGAVSPKSPFSGDQTPPTDITGFVVDIQDDPAGVLLTQRAVAEWVYDTGDTTIRGFHVQYKKDAEVNWRTVSVLEDDLTFPFVITTGLDPDTAYDFRIRAYDQSGNFSGWTTYGTVAEVPTVDPTLFHSITIGGGGSIQSDDYVTNGEFGFYLDDNELVINNGTINARAINAGVLRSSEPARDGEGNIIEESPGVPLPAWQIDLEGDAVLGNSWVRGNLTVGPAGQNDSISVIQSASYSPGQAGWVIRSDGTAEFRSVAAGSFPGGALQPGTVSADVLEASTVLSSEVIVDGSIHATGGMGEDVGLSGEGFLVLGPYQVNVTNKALTSNVATLTTSQNHGFEVGNRLIVSDVGSPFDGDFTVASVTSNTVSYAVSASNVASTTATGLVKSLSNNTSVTRPVLIEFPTDGASPNIISGELTSNLLLVTQGATLRGTSTLQREASLVLENSITAPKSSPIITSNYNDSTLTGSIWGTPIGFVKGHDGARYVASNTSTTMYVSRYVNNAYTGIVWSAPRNDSGWTTAYTWTTAAAIHGLTYSPTHQAYFILYKEVYTQTVTATGAVTTRRNDELHVYNTSWVKSNSNGGVLTDEGNNNGWDGSCAGWDFVNSRPLIALFDGSSARIYPYSISGSHGAGWTLTLGTQTACAGASALTKPGFVARINNLDGNGLDRYYIKNHDFGTSGYTKNFLPYTTAGALANADQWGAAYYNTYMSGAYYDSANGLIYHLNVDKIYEYQSKDSYWSGSNITETRWYRYSWAEEKGATSADWHETDLSPTKQFTFYKKSKAIATIGNIPVGNNGVNDPDRAHIYTVRGEPPEPTYSVDGAGNANWDRIATVIAPAISTSIEPRTANSGILPRWKNSNQFAALGATPATITSGAGLYIGADGRIQGVNPSISLTTGNAQSIPTSTWTKHSLGVDTRFPQRGTIGASSSSIRIDVTGWYMVSGGVTWPSGATSGRRYVSILNTPTTTATQTEYVADNIVSEQSVAAFSGVRISTSGVCYLVAGTYLSLMVFQDTGGSISTAATTGTTGHPYTFLRASMIP